MANTNVLVNDKTAEFKTDTLTVKKNILRFNSVSVQISNISSIEQEYYHTEKPAGCLAVGLIFLSLAGFVWAWVASERYVPDVIYGLIFLLAIVGGLALLIYCTSQDIKKYYLAIYTNCGRHYRLFIGENKNINWEVLDVLEYLIENGGYSEAINISMQDAYITDMTGATISGSQFLNKMNNSKIQQ